MSTLFYIFQFNSVT